MRVLALLRTTGRRGNSAPGARVPRARAFEALGISADSPCSRPQGAGSRRSRVLLPNRGARPLG